MSSEPASSSPQAALDAYLDDAMGVRFDALSRFATPIFDLYGVDLTASFADRSGARPPGEIQVIVTALDTARLFWAYFLLEDDEQQHYKSALKRCLIGVTPDKEAEASFYELLELMREQWASLPASMRAHACDTAPSSLPAFDQLLEKHGDPAPSESANAASTYGAKQLEQPEALALFAQPLLDDPAVHTDPDALEARMARAAAYWELAHEAPGERDAKLETLLRRFADSPDDREHLRQEARDMLDRFEELFPDRAD